MIFITPGSSNILGTFDTPGTAYGVDVIGSYAFVADGAKGLEVFNISTTTPIFLDSISTPDISRKVKVSGGYAFVTADYSGVRIIDITGLPSSLLYLKLDIMILQENVMMFQ